METKETPEEMRRRVGKSAFVGIEGAFILVSARMLDDPKGELPASLRATMTFFYDGGKYGVEWEPCAGPIQIWSKCEKDAERAKPHHFYDYHNSTPFSWSQRAVEREGLQDAFVSGNYEHIFAVLKEWAERA